MEKKRVVVVIDDNLHYRIKKEAYTEKKTIKQKFVELFEKWLKGKK